jgi:hypothetical protein
MEAIKERAFRGVNQGHRRGTMPWTVWGGVDIAAGQVLVS